MSARGYLTLFGSRVRRPVEGQPAGAGRWHQQHARPRRRTPSLSPELHPDGRVAAQAGSARTPTAWPRRPPWAPSTSATTPVRASRGSWISSPRRAQLLRDRPDRRVSSAHLFGLYCSKWRSRRPCSPAAVVLRGPATSPTAPAASATLSGVLLGVKVDSRAPGLFAKRTGLCV